MTADRELARCEAFDVGIEHGQLVMAGNFAGECWGQGFGYSVDPQFILRLMRVFGVDRLQKINGKPCWVVHDSLSIHRVEPLFAGDGEPFDVLAWAKARQP